MKQLYGRDIDASYHLGRKLAILSGEGVMSNSDAGLYHCSLFSRRRLFWSGGNVGLCESPLLLIGS